MKKIVYSFLLIAILSACDKPEQIGPGINGIYGPVTVTQAFTVNMSNPNFAAGNKVYFTARFENDAIWTITLVGQTSGAVKTITGISKEIGAYNSEWTGTADDAPSFRAENVVATLSFASSTSTYTQNLTIAAQKNLDAGGVLVSNFATTKFQCYCAPPLNPNNWPTDFPTTVNTDNTYIKPDGNAYVLMEGVPWQGGGSPYVDIATIEAKNADVNYGTYFPLYADPAKVYFNIMVYGDPATTSNTWLRISLFEDGVEARVIDVRPDWTGWKLLSYNYTELLPVDATIGASKPNKVTALRFVLLSDSPTLPGPSVRAVFDHPIFTHNKPYQP
ncbi:MAG: hypothetical protein K2X86_04880 [Cytophagaceae bacterium]|nr:hypothetical protein [Cytophagaceae bacterium]